MLPLRTEVTRYTIMAGILASSVANVLPFPPYGSEDIPTACWLQLRLQQRIFTVFPGERF